MLVPIYSFSSVWDCEDRDEAGMAWGWIGLGRAGGVVGIGTQHTRIHEYGTEIRGLVLGGGRVGILIAIGVY